MNSARRRLIAITTLIVLVVVGLAGVFAAGASAGTLVRPQNVVAPIGVAGSQLVGAHQPVLAGQRRVRAPDYDRMAVGSSVAAEGEASGGAAAVRLGQAGEDAVRGAYDIGPKFTTEINGRTRIFDGLTAEAVSEVKNVGYQAYTQQLKDSLAYAEQSGRYFDLYVRSGGGTRLSGPLADAIASNPMFRLRYIP